MAAATLTSGLKNLYTLTLQRFHYFCIDPVIGYYYIHVFKAGKGISVHFTTLLESTKTTA